MYPERSRRKKRTNKFPGFLSENLGRERRAAQAENDLDVGIVSCRGARAHGADAGLGTPSPIIEAIKSERKASIYIDADP
jgi:hypothetical protein